MSTIRKSNLVLFAGLAFAASALVGCAGTQPTQLAGQKQLPDNWLKLSEEDWRVHALPEPTRQYLTRVRENMAQEREGSYYKFYGRYSDALVRQMADANEAANTAFITSPKVVNGNLTPELYSTAETYNESNWHWAVQSNDELRSMKDDWARFWLADSPSRLSPYPIMPTTGSP